MDIEMINIFVVNLPKAYMLHADLESPYKKQYQTIYSINSLYIKKEILQDKAIIQLF